MANNQQKEAAQLKRDATALLNSQREVKKIAFRAERKAAAVVIAGLITVSGSRLGIQFEFEIIIGCWRFDLQEDLYISKYADTQKSSNKISRALASYPSLLK
jgi:hypothetical protein